MPCSSPFARLRDSWKPRCAAFMVSLLTPRPIGF